MRPYREGDLDGVAAIFNAGFEADSVEIAYGEEDVEGMVSGPGFDVERQALVVEGLNAEDPAEEAIIGFGSVHMRDNPDDNSRTYSLSMDVDPAMRATELPRTIARKLIEIIRSIESDPDRAAASEVEVRDFLSPRSVWRQEFYESLGLREERRFYMMSRPLDSIEEPKHVERVLFRKFEPVRDDEPSREAYNDSFRDHFGSHASSVEAWQHRLERQVMRLDMSWVAEIDGEGGRLAGFCLASVYASENEQLGRNWAWIELLGTVRDWRGKGVARGLIARALQTFKEAGFDTGALGVDTGSLTGANRLYELVGFGVHDVWLNYRAPLDELTA